MSDRKLDTLEKELGLVENQLLETSSNATEARAAVTILYDDIAALRGRMLRIERLIDRAMALSGAEDRPSQPDRLAG